MIKSTFRPTSDLSLIGWVSNKSPTAVFDLPIIDWKEYSTIHQTEIITYFPSFLHVSGNLSFSTYLETLNSCHLLETEVWLILPSRLLKNYVITFFTVYIIGHQWISLIFDLWLWQVVPRWHEHWTSNKVYDGDMIVLQGQEKIFLSKSKEGSADVNEQYTQITFTPTQSDRFVLAFRNWLRRHGNSQPDWFGISNQGPLPSTVLSKRQVWQKVTLLWALLPSSH